ncbi:hypothetical protein FAGAP_8537 [Fusarium agapanthi]|uniref:Uncharacterized protein n=1 Tax=Fusarium agapanthi TaxID=1803897 RepID=A0A9P5B5H8_9HYPO|nr:hypothetical protein FAGAP_8537 [Fusarium agapanthi]
MSGGYNRPCYFGAPLGSKHYKSLDGSSDKNVSTYMIDFGLWTAYKESRRVIRKHFDDPSNNLWGLTERGRPGSDLFILDFESFFDTNWSPIEAFPGTPESSPCPLECCREIGIQYNSEVTDNNLLQAPSGSWVDMTLTANLLLFFSLERRLWLVDTNLKQKKGAVSSHDSDTMQFYASNRKFVQVPLDKGEDNLTEWEYINPVAGGNFWRSSIHYARRANEVARSFRALPGSTAINNEHRLEDRIGLLGWEELENS